MQIIHKFRFIINSYLKKITLFVFIAGFIFFATTQIHAQNNPETTEKKEDTDAKKSDKNNTSNSQTETKNKAPKRYRVDYDERFRFIWGFGRLEHLPGVLSEAGPAWMLNSFVASGADQNNSPVFQLSDPENLKAWSAYAEADYTFNDRITAGIKYYSINQKYGRKDPARIDFFLPASDLKRWSYFEGVRLTKYKEENKTIYFKYLHPVLWKGFKAGIYISREWYDERNEISFGSYVATTITSTIAPGTTNWSQGGIIPVVFDMKGYSVGPAFRYQLFDWLGFHYKLTPVERKGNMTMSGVRVVQQQNDFTRAEAGSALIPIGFAEVSDSGIRHDLQAVFRFLCRYTLHIGILKEDFDRTYSGYFAKNFATGNLPYQEKTPTGLGIGEMSSSFKIEKLEIYMKFGTSFFF